MKFVDFKDGKFRVDGTPVSKLIAFFRSIKPAGRVEKVFTWDLSELIRELLKKERSDVTKLQILFGKKPAYIRIGNFYFYGITCHILGNARMAEKMSRADFLFRLLRFYNDIGVEKIHATIASTAREFWKERFCPDYAVDFTREPKDFCMGSMYPARCEIFTKRAFDAEVEPGRCFHYDINSAYGSIMLGEFPEPVAFTAGVCLDAPGVSEVVMRHPFGHWFKFGIWPSDDPAQYFSADKATVRLPNAEIRAMIAQGYEILAVLGGWHCRHTGWRPLESYVRFMMAKRAAYKAEGKKFEERLCKQMVNMLYGQFSQRPVKSVTLSRSEWRRLSRKERHGQPWRSFFGEWYVRDERGRYQPHVNVLWSAMIAGEIRHRLNRVLMAVSGRSQELLYTDTDSVIYVGDTPLEEIEPAICGPEPGQWQRRNEYSFFRAVMQKYYLFKDISGDVGAVIAGCPEERKPDIYKKMLAQVGKFN